MKKKCLDDNSLIEKIIQENIFNWSKQRTFSRNFKIYIFNTNKLLFKIFPIGKDLIQLFAKINILVFFFNN